MNLTKLQKIERDIMSLEIDYNPRASNAYKIKWRKRISELREQRKKLMHTDKYNFKR